MSTQAAEVRSRKGQVMALFEERHQMEAPPFGDVLELYHFMKQQGSDFEDVDVAVAVGRLVCEGRLRYALDGLRLVT